MTTKSKVLLVTVPVLATVTALGWTFRKAIFYSAWTALGGNPKCRALDVLRAKANQRLGGKITEAIRRRSRLIQADPDGYELWETPHRRFWIPRGMDLLPHNLSEQEREVYGSQPHESVRSGDVVIDCGANVGVFVSRALRAGAKLVVAVEPSPENLVCLRRNFETELAQGSVVVVPKGVFDRQGTLDFAIGSDHTSNRFILNPRRRSTAGLLQLPVTTIDTLVGELSLPDVDFIKMDIEGSERYALKGAMQTLKRFRPRLAISVYHRPDDPDAICDLVGSAGAGYQMQCGACSFDVNRLRLHPEIMFFN